MQKNEFEVMVKELLPDSVSVSAAFQTSSITALIPD